MKLIVEGGLYQLLYAACTYASEHDPSVRINEYMIVNDLLPPNIRSDNSQPNVWRDYQQVLAELGFIYSTKVTNGVIIPTSVGLYLLDHKDSLPEILTYQTLLYQYPNGGKREYLHSQIENNVLLRPAVLIWRVLANLVGKSSFIGLSASEIKDFLMRCTIHLDSEECSNAIIKFRNTGQGLNTNSLSNANRNASDWMVLLSQTLLFTAVQHNSRRHLTFSNYSLENFEKINLLIVELEQSETFWVPSIVDNDSRKEWYAFYGAQRLELELPATSAESLETGEQEDINNDSNRFRVPGELSINPFSPERLNFNLNSHNQDRSTVESSYDGAMVANKHRLHDSMVIYIAEHCKKKGAEVFEDPSSLDLLVIYSDTEYLIEVKTIGPKNYVNRLRYAVGQLFHYDYLLPNSLNKRRKVLAVAGVLPKSDSLKSFFTKHLSFDLLSLVPSREGQVLRCDSLNDQSKELFL